MNIYYPRGAAIDKELVEEIRPRGPVYCPFHFLAVAAKYYNANVEASRTSLADLQHRRNEELDRLKLRRKRQQQPPTRVQPTRKAKTTNSKIIVESKEAKLVNAIEKRYAKLVADLLIPKSNCDIGNVMGLAEWKDELVRLIGKEETRKRSGRDGARLDPCHFGSLPWLCRLCEQGKEASIPPGSRDTSAVVVEWHRRYSPVPVMGEAPVEGVCDEEYWRIVPIPKKNVVRLGGLRFTVDVCSGTMLMFV